MQIVQSNLVMVGLNSASPKVFHGGVEVLGIRDIRTDWDDEEPRVKIKVFSGMNAPDLLAALRSENVIVKEV